MEKFYLQIAERLDQKVEGLMLIDEETGQLTESEDGYPVIFPCALIDVASTDWSIDRNLALRGSALITIKHAFDCVEDTHYSSRHYQQFAGLESRVRQHRQLLQALHGWSPGDRTPLVLTQSRQYTLFGRIKVYEETFSTRLSKNLVQEA